MTKSKSGLIVAAISAVFLVSIAAMTVGINDAGYRTVIQYPTGTMSIKFSSGVYFPWFGKTTTYPDYLTFDFSASDGNCTFGKDGVKVRYQDGGEGTVCGMANVQLPTDEKTMLEFHNRYRDDVGARNKLLNQSLPKALNLTAALMSSEEAYATKRSEFINMASEQAKKGLYVTKLVNKEVQVGVDKTGKPEMQKRDVPVIQINSDGTAKTQGSDFDKYGVTVVQFDLKAWDFENKTLKQISDKREAEMAIITSKANAKKAYFAEQQVIADGKKAVAAAEYAAKKIAETAIQKAEANKKLALIEASRVKEQAMEMTLAAVEATKQKRQEALQALEAEKVTVTNARAEAAALKLVQQGGIIKLRIDAAVQMNKDNAAATAAQKVPTTVIYSGATGAELGSRTGVSDILDTQLIKNLKALNSATQ